MIPPIPARAGNWKITGITPFQDDVTLQLAYPHGHLRLTDMTYVLTYPDGREETILSVPKYDFNWQLVYEWAQPLHVPAGSTIKAIAHYDNSPRNKLNPAPNSEVIWSEQSTDEMFNGFVDLSIDKMDVRLEANRSASAESPRPTVPLVTATGCVATSADGTRTLTHAAVVTRSEVLHADAAEISQARNAALGADTYRLVGTADFSPIGDLLASGQRGLFTNETTANATGVLVAGRKVAIKGLLIPGTPPALNVLSAQLAADSCH
jgi:hypothetical protein